MAGLANIDLLSVGIAVAAIGVLGFAVFFSNRRSITNKSFLFLSWAIIFWSIFNYSFYQIAVPVLSFLILRWVMFFAVWFAFFVFQLLYVFPREKVNFSNTHKLFLIPLVIFTSILTLTPFVFSEIVELSSTGRIARVANGPGIFLFGAVVGLLNFGGIVFLFKKLIKAIGVERRQYGTVLIGIFLTLVLIMVFNFILPAFFDNPRFIPLGALFIFPFVAFTSYAILKHHLLGVRVIATEILTFFLAVVVLYEVIFADSLTIRILRSGVFLLVLAFGILLIKSVRREVEQRERMERMTAELETVNERLKELDHLKSEFLNFASHQVKSPMATVKGFATLIEDGTHGQVSDKAKEGAHKIRGAADRLISLVNNLLDLGKIEAGKLDFNMQEMDIVKLIATMVDEYQILAQNKKLTLSFEFDKPSLTIKADAEKLRQVIQNLIDNAIKYTDSGSVRVTIQDEYTSQLQHPDKLENVGVSPGVLITVADTGRGMSSELLQKLFGRFVRGEKTKTEVMGTGLGLYIAKQIVEAHHGGIWAESEGQGKGSNFFVRLARG